MRAFVVLTLAALLVAPAYAWTSDDAMDIAAVENAFAAVRAACVRDRGRLWGVSLDGPILVVDPTTRRAAANRPDAEGRLTDSGAVFVGSVPSDLPLANTAVVWAGVRWAMVLWPLPADATERTALLLHESFHREQGALGLPIASPSNAHLDTMEGRTLMRLEWRALAAAVGASGKTRARALEDALVFRETRRSRAAGAREDERALELNEGLAEYTGRVLAAGDVPSRVRALLAEAEAKPSFTRSFAYASGPAYGLLLDARSGSWRHRIEAEDDLGALAARAYGVRGRSASPAEIDRRAARYGGDAVRAAELARDASRRERDARAIARYVDGPVLVVPLRRMQVTFDPNTLEPLGDRGTVYPTMTIADEWGTLTVRSGALLAADWSRVTLPAPALGGTAHTVAGDGWSIVLANGWRLVPGVRAGDATLVPSEAVEK